MANLYFTQLACNGWESEVTATLQHLLLSGGATMLDFVLPEGETTENGRTASSAWLDCNHPTIDRATDIVTSLITQMGLDAGSSVLVLGDSTTSFCIDRVTWNEESRDYEYNWEMLDKMQKEVLSATGVVLHHYGVSGSSFDSRSNFEWCLHKARMKGSYDHILLIGGWNQTAWGDTVQEKEDYLGSMVTSFIDACKATS